MKPNLRTRFPDLPGWYANPVTGGWVIYDKEELSSSIGFYDDTGILVLSTKNNKPSESTGHNRLEHKCEGGIHQAMRMAFLLFQQQKEMPEPEAKRGPDGLMRFRDMPGILVHYFTLRGVSGGLDVTGFDVYRNEFLPANHIAHYMRKSKNLWLHPESVVIAVQPFPTMMQAVRFVYLKIQDVKS